MPCNHRPLYAMSPILGRVSIPSCDGDALQLTTGNNASQASSQVSIPSCDGDALQQYWPRPPEDFRFRFQYRLATVMPCNPQPWQLPASSRIVSIPSCDGDALQRKSSLITRTSSHRFQYRLATVMPCNRIFRGVGGSG